MAGPRKILVVIDPTTDNQHGLTRAVGIAKNAGARIHSYLAVYSEHDTDDIEALRRAETTRNELWLEDVVEPIRADGIEVDTEVDWQENWRDAFGRAAEKPECELIVKSAYHRSGKRYLLETADWTLLRAARCPVFPIKTEDTSNPRPILAAVNIASTDEAHKKLNDAVIRAGKTAEEIEKAERTWSMPTAVR